MIDISFNGVYLSNYGTITDIKRDILPPRRLSTMDIPKQVGSYFFHRTVESRVFEVEILIVGDIRTTCDQLASVLDTEEPKAIVFSDDTSKTYYGILTGESTLAEIRNTGRGTLTFFVPYPYAEGAEVSESFDPDGSKTFSVAGTAETFPITTAVFNSDATFFSYANGDDYVMIGSPADIDQSNVPEWEYELTDNCDTTTGWATATYVDGGTVTGTMDSDGNEFEATDYGSGSDWHGPALKKSLPSPVTDFEVEVQVNFKAYTPEQIGRLEVYLLDSNSTVIGKMAIKDAQVGVERNHVEMRAGGLNTGHYFTSTSRSEWKDFSGTLRISRVGNRWDSFAGQLNYDKGIHEYTVEDYWYDNDNEFTGDLAQVELHIGANDTHEAPDPSKFNYVRVKKRNDVSGDSTANVVFQAGDELIINHENNKVYLNGFKIMRHIDPGTTFFGLKPGSHTIATAPASSSDVTMTYKPMFL